MTSCSTCQLIAAADDEGKDRVIAQQSLEIDRLTNRLAWYAARESPRTSTAPPRQRP